MSRLARLVDIVVVPVLKVEQWLAIAGNRGRLYRAARFVLPVLVAAGFLSSGLSSHVLAVLALAATFGVPHVAARHTPRPSRRRRR